MTVTTFALRAALAPVRILALGLALGSLAACGDDPEGDDHHHDENEVITTVTLTFTPAGGGAAVVAAFDDPDGDGGEAPTADPIALTAGESYALAVAFANGLEDPPEDITEEVQDEGDEHQLFFTGTAVDGPASDRPGAALAHAYADEDAAGLPVGLESEVVATAGSGGLTVTLRHLPPVGDVAAKVEGLAETVAAEGFAAIGGTTDAAVDFDVTVE